MPRANNLLVLYDNRALDATLTASSELTPVDRLKEIRPGRKWRAAAPAQTAWAVIDHGAAGVPRTHGYIFGHSLQVGGTIRVRTGDDPLLAAADPTGAMPDTDQELEAWVPVSGFGDDGWGVSLGGYPQLTTFRDWRPYQVWRYGSTVTGRYTRVDLTQVTATTIDVGVLFDGVGRQFTYNLGFGWDLEWVDPSEVEDTESSQAVRARVPYRELRLDLPIVPSDEALTALDDLHRILGRRRPVLVQIFPSADLVTAYRTTLYGLRPDTAGTRQISGRYYSSGMTVRELPE